jgi:hypothetical protein
MQNLYLIFKDGLMESYDITDDLKSLKEHYPLNKNYDIIEVPMEAIIDCVGNNLLD